MEDLFGNPQPTQIKTLKNKSGGYNFNPCISVFGNGPEGAKCKDCKHLFYVQCSNRYYKCELRGKPTASPSNDHKVNWPACGKYEKWTDPKL